VSSTTHTARRAEVASDARARAARARKRTILRAGALVFLLFILFPLLTAFTPALDGTVGGIGIAYVAGFAEVLAALGIAFAYARWANREEERRS
jgi:uncharacterized membrane protein (DUF485 family)